MFLLAQIPSEPPSDFAALQWVMVGMLTAALVYVFRLWQSEKRNCSRYHMEAVDLLLKLLDEKYADEDGPGRS